MASEPIEFPLQTASKKTGILLLNLGTPDAPTPKAVRRYLNEFLSDTRVVNLPKLLWQPILKGIILPFRPKKTAHAYQQIWQADGSPLLAITKQQGKLLQAKLDKISTSSFVEVGMRYGNPSIEHALESLRAKQIERLIVLPLYPQYSTSTTLSTFDKVTDVLKTWKKIPEIQFINEYYLNPHYIKALVKSVQEYWNTHEQPQRLIFSFHGLPKKLVEDGDPYQDQCLATAEAIARGLQLEAHQWQVTFQSRFGPAEWLQPYTDKTLEALPAQGVNSVHIMCPGFSADCLETLEEISMENHEIFLEAGGESFDYIPALNSRDEHIDLLVDLTGIAR